MQQRRKGAQCEQRWAHLSAFIVSSKLASLGLMQAIMSVRLFPPSESCKMRVSLLSRYLQRQ